MSSLTLWPSTEKLCRLAPRFFSVIFVPEDVNVVGSNTLSLVVSVVVSVPPPGDGDSLGEVVVGELDGEDPPPQATPNRARAAASTVKRTSFMTNSFRSTGVSGNSEPTGHTAGPAPRMGKGSGEVARVRPVRLARCRCG